MSLFDDVTELSVLWPHLAVALERDAGTAEGERTSGGADAAFRLPVNADVSAALATVSDGVPQLATWAALVVAEEPRRRDVASCLRHMPRWHERMLATAATIQADALAAAVAALLRRTKVALGLRFRDRRLGQFCPLHDDPLTELIEPGAEATLRYRHLDRFGQPVGVAIDWMRRDKAFCRTCRASWLPGQYLMLSRQLREADARRIAREVT